MGLTKKNSFLLAWALLGGLLWMALPAIADQDWRKTARFLYGEDQAAQASAEENLRAIPKLPSLLREALRSGAETELALKVIEALSLGDLLPDVMAFGRSDKSGRSLLTVRVLKDGGNSETVDKYFSSLINGLVIPGHASRKVAILGGLPEVPGRIPENITNALLSDPSFEVRVEYARYVARLMKADPAAAFGKWRRLAVARPYQVRVEALSGLKGLKAPPAEYIANLEFCLNDRNPAVKTLCREIRDRPSR